MCYTNEQLHYRIVSLEMATNISIEIRILCSQPQCGLYRPRRMAAVEDKIFVVDRSGWDVHILEGKENCSQ